MIPACRSATGLRRFLLGSVALLAVPAAALGQTTPPPDAATSAVTLPGIDVQATAWRSWQPVDGYVAPLTTTGTKTDTPLIEAPQSVGVVTRDQMDDQGARTVSEALRYTAGVLPEVRPTARYDSVYVRGFGGQGASAAYVNFLDGLRMQRGISFAAPNVDPWLLERIEVLRGPASVLYGQTGSGGIVNLVSRRPIATDGGEVRLEAGTNSFAQAAFDMGGRATEDGTWLYRLTGVTRSSQTQYDHNEEERYAFAPALTWQPNDNTTLTLLANFQYDPQSGFYNFVPAIGTVLASPYGKLHSNFFGGDPNWNMFERTQASAGYQLEHRFDNVWTARQNFRYQHIDSDFRAVSGRTLTGGRTLARSYSRSVEHVDALALDNQLQASFSTGELRHTLLMGVDWSRASSKRRLGQATAPALDIFAPVYYIAIPSLNLATTTQVQDQLGVYAQDQIAWGNWRFNVGVREDWASTEITTRSTGAPTRQDDTATTGRVGALYLFDNGIAPYASWATSFLPNSGTFSPARGGSAFEPTTGELFEIGVKYQPPGRESFIQLAAFQITQQNVLTTDPDNSLYQVQTGEIRSRGIELEARASLGGGFDLIGAYAYTEAEITKSNSAGVSGNDAPQVPRHAASAWAHYSFGEGRLSGLGVGAGVRYVGATYGDEQNSFRVPSVTLMDAALSYDLSALGETLKGLEAHVNASNLFDKEYISSCSNTTNCWFGNRRVVTAGITYRW